MPPAVAVRLSRSISSLHEVSIGATARDPAGYAIGPGHLLRRCVVRPVYSPMVLTDQPTLEDWLYARSPRAQKALWVLSTGILLVGQLLVILAPAWAPFALGEEMGFYRTPVGPAAVVVMIVCSSLMTAFYLWYICFRLQLRVAKYVMRLRMSFTFLLRLAYTIVSLWLYATPANAAFLVFMLFTLIFTLLWDHNCICDYLRFGEERFRKMHPDKQSPARRIPLAISLAFPLLIDVARHFAVLAVDGAANPPHGRLHVVTIVPAGFLMRSRAYTTLELADALFLGTITLAARVSLSMVKHSNQLTIQTALRLEPAPALHERRSGEESAKADDVGEANAAPAAVDTDDVEAAVFEEVSTTVRRTSGDV